jgi:simple sugar transport system substrate-binding protein
MTCTQAIRWCCFLLAMIPGLAAGVAGAKEPLRLVFITCCKDEAFFGPAKKGMADAAKMMNVQCEFTGTEGVDLEAQAGMVRKAVADGYDGIALNIIDAKAFDAVIAEAAKKGVPVVAFNVDAMEGTRRSQRLCGVSQDFYQAGRKLGAKALELIPKDGKVLITQHDHGIAALDDRLKGIQESLATKGIPSKVICSTNDPKKAVELIAAELKADPKIRFVLGTGQTDTEAAGRAIERDFAGRGYGSAGFDLSPEILRLLKADVIRFTIDQQPYIQGFYPVVQLTLYLRYGIQPSNIDAGAGVITKKDADRVVELSNQHYR